MKVSWYHIWLLVDEPDLDGVVDGALFMVCDADDECRVFPSGEIAWVSFCFPGGFEEVEFGECFPGFWHGDDINERHDDNQDGDYKNDGEGSIDFTFLFWECQREREDESFLRVGLFPSVDPKYSDGENEEKN